MQARHFLPIPADVEQVGRAVLDAAFKVHTELGPGLLESVYEACSAFVLRDSGLYVETQVALPVTYHNVEVEAAMRLDMLVEKKVIVELKAVESMMPLYDAQLITYLKLTGLRLGYLINFNVSHLRDGIKRIVR